MKKSIKIIFPILVLVQGLHSIEEYIGRLWENFPPATFLTGLISENLETGFLIINIGIFVFGIWYWLFPILGSYSYANFLLWFWILLETINGIGHPIWALYQGQYTPGLATSPILMVLSLLLYRQQVLTD